MNPEGGMCPMRCTLSPTFSAACNCSTSQESWPAGSVSLMYSQLKKAESDGFDSKICYQLTSSDCWHSLSAVK